MTTAPSPTPKPTTITAQPTGQIKLLYDGECPLCLREVELLQRRDAGRGLVDFVDIADPDYCAEDHGGVSYEDAMARIHAVRANGEVIQNVAVFREIYDVLGMGWIYAPTRWPVVGAIADWLYGIWAKWRLQLTGRPDLATVVATRREQQGCNGEAAVCEVK